MGMSLLALPILLVRGGVKMKILTIFTVLIFMIGFMLSANQAQSSISIELTGSWSKIVNESNLQDGAGSDFVNTYESDVDQASLDILETVGNPWIVDVKKSNVNHWPNDLHFYVRRTLDGVGAGTIIGGLIYQEITNTNQLFFSGSGDRLHIPLQFKLEGVSATLLKGNYSIQIYYTVLGE
jgi:hypothetical protein